MYMIPITTAPNQKFQCTIPIDGNNRTLNFELRYNAVAKYWTMSISDSNTNKRLIDSLPITVGEYPAANLLGQYGYLGIGSATIVKVGSASENINPDDQTLGTNYILVWGDTIA